MEKVITSNSEQVLKAKWDGERFSLIELNRESNKAIILNPREAKALADYIHMELKTIMVLRDG